VFERLFGVPGAGDRAAGAGRAERRRKSILDLVAAEARQLQDVLGGSDRRKLDEYLTGVRELERRIQQARPTHSSGATNYPPPLGIPADYEEHLRLMADLLALSFQCDLTRIATFVFANDGSNRSYPKIGVPDGHHDLSHHGGDAAKRENIAKINRFHVAQLAYFLRRLKSVQEGDATLLDHCLIVYGSGISDGNSHAHDNLPILLAGNANGSVKTARHIHFPAETPLTNLHVWLLNRMGAHTTRFGDSTGALPALQG
jgi:Protein of unknown function (DUF1552)